MSKRQNRSHRQTAQSNTYRFFVSGDVLHGRDVTIQDPEIAHQLNNVLRLQPGDQVLLLDNTGWQYTISITSIARDRVGGTVERKELAPGEPRTKLTLYVGLMRPERFEWVLQKGTELGVSVFVPMVSERSSVGDASELSERKIERWNKIIREAAEQARRGKLPRLAPPLPFASACEQAAQRTTALLLWEGGGVPSLRQALLDAKAQPEKNNSFSFALISGPEGGFTSTELEASRDCGIIPVTLGPRTLRAETAPLAAATALLYELGDLE
jgi:16S rRNA (uracil1498-N3)-methyltransferase